MEEFRIAGQVGWELVNVFNYSTSSVEPERHVVLMGLGSFTIAQNTPKVLRAS
jgi:hypothetical protein